MINGFFLGWLYKFFTLKKGIASLLQVRFFFLNIRQILIVLLKISAHFDTLFSFEVDFLSVLYSFKRYLFKPTFGKLMLNVVCDDC